MSVPQDEEEERKTAKALYSESFKETESGPRRMQPDDGNPGFKSSFKLQA